MSCIRRAAQRAGRAAVATAVLASGGVACSDGEPAAVDEVEVEAEAAAKLAAEVGQPTPDVDCPGDLPAEVGATLQCSLSAAGDEAIYPVTITVTDVGGGEVEFDAAVGPAPTRTPTPLPRQ